MKVDTEACIKQQPKPEHYTYQVTKLGLADKVQLGWESPWWGNAPLDLSVIFTENMPGEMVSKSNKPEMIKKTCH